MNSQTVQPETTEQSSSAKGTDLRLRLHDLRNRNHDLTRNSKLMIIDDERYNVMVVEKYLRDAGYEKFVTTSNSSTALQLIRSEKPDVLLLDIMMPQVSGLDILHALSIDGVLDDLPTIVMTASSDADVKLVCLDLGACDFLPKPIDPVDLVPRVRNALKNKIYRDQLTQHMDHLEQMVAERTQEVIQSREEVIRCLARAAECRDDITGNHVLRVGQYAHLIAKELGFDDASADLIDLAAQLHDVGKIGIPDSVLHKPGKLDPDEYDIIQRHCAIGRKIIEPMGIEDWGKLKTHTVVGAKMLNVKSSPLMMLAARIAQSHHERWDGKGYPLGLKGEDIPLEGRIVAVADVYDALSTERPYKKSLPRDECFRILEEGRGTQFDPQVLDAFFRISDEIVKVQMQYLDLH